MPAIAPPESPLPPEAEAEGEGEALEVAAAEAAVFCDEDVADVNEDEEGMLLLSSASDIVDVDPKFEDIGPIAVVEGEGTGVLS